MMPSRHINIHFSKHIKMHPGGVRMFPLWTVSPPLPKGGAGWSQTGYSTPGSNPRWNARCTAFCEHGAGHRPAQFITPGGRCQGNLITPLAALSPAIHRVWLGRTLGAMLHAPSLKSGSVTLTDEMPTLKFSWLAQKPL